MARWKWNLPSDKILQSYATPGTVDQTSETRRGLELALAVDFDLTIGGACHDASSGTDQIVKLVVDAARRFFSRRIREIITHNGDVRAVSARVEDKRVGAAIAQGPSLGNEVGVSGALEISLDLQVIDLLSARFHQFAVIDHAPKQVYVVIGSIKQLLVQITDGTVI